MVLLPPILVESVPRSSTPQLDLVWVLSSLYLSLFERV